MTGAEWPDFKGRFARLREAVRLMRQLWTEDGVSFEGEFYRTVDATVYDKPEQPGAGVHRRGRAGGGEVRGPVR